MISALAVYDLTDEIPRSNWIAIRHGTTAKSHAQTKIVRYRNVDLGKTTIKLDGVEVPIFDKERTIIDAFRHLGIEVAIKALKIAMKAKSAEKIDLRKLQKYAKELRVEIDPYVLTVTT